MTKLIDIADEHLEALKIQAVKEGKSFKAYLEDKIVRDISNKTIDAEYQKRVAEYKAERGGEITELAELSLEDGFNTPVLMNYLYETFLDLVEKESEFGETVKWIEFLSIIIESCQSYININKENLFDKDTIQYNNIPSL